MVSGTCDCCNKKDLVVFLCERSLFKDGFFSHHVWLCENCRVLPSVLYFDVRKRKRGF